jgi:type I restriction enzyme, S subunit
MKSTVVQIQDLIAKGVWSYEPFSHKYRLAERALEDSPYNLVPLQDIVRAHGRGFSSIETHVSGEIPILSASDITDEARIDKQSEKYISLEKHNRLDKSAVTKGDILLAVYVPQAGNVAVWYDREEPANVDSSLIRLRLSRRRADPRYLVLFLNSSLGKLLLNMIAKGSVRPKIDTSSLLDIVIPLPPMSEQLKLLEAVTQKRREAALLEERAQTLRLEAARLVEIFLGLEEKDAS